MVLCVLNYIICSNDLAIRCSRIQFKRTLVDAGLGSNLVAVNRLQPYQTSPPLMDKSEVSQLDEA